ncbi:MAG TPA: FAD-dependent monooxygenase [Burkholderiales bacterium]|nr:FAD-dependent monooxygenase [Burkholderiales bacterium]
MTPAPDVLIQGAGPVGRALALALRASPLHVVLIGGVGPATFRPIVLSHASRLILERLDAWKSLPVTPIERIHVSQQHGFGRVRMDANDAGVPALGYVTEYSALVRALEVDVAPAADATDARCIVHAEGLSDAAHEKRYAQDALVAIVRFEPPAAMEAFERFTPEGPLALLPFAGRYAVVWSSSPERAKELGEMNDASFLESLSKTAGRRPGRPVAVESRALQPLALRVRTARVTPREVYIGNAAQTLHPVAGQGLNLGLRDAWELATAWRDAIDPGDPALLAAYARRRSLDAGATVRITDFLAGAFLGSRRGMRAARGAALSALDLLPPARRFFARRMIYGPRAVP